MYGEVNLRLQLAWGGPTHRLWRGVVHLPGGQFEDVRLLGLDLDQPGAFVVQQDRILVEPRRASQYSGLEVTVIANSRDDVMEFVLVSDQPDEVDQIIRIPIETLIEEGYAQSLGKDQKLRIARAAGDTLRVRFSKPSLVFEPGEQVSMALTPSQVGTKPNALVRARLRLKKEKTSRADVADFWSQNSWDWEDDRELRADDQARVEATQFVIPIPEEEGVYNLTIDLITTRLNRLHSKLATRTVQFVVIDSRQPALFGHRPATEVTSFDPANPSWLEQLPQLPQLPQWRLIPGAKKGPWSNQETETSDVGDKTWAKLAGGQWIAYSLPISDPNVPHILEVEFPSRRAQDVGISLWQENVAASLAPVSLDSGVTMGDPDLNLFEDLEPNEPRTHRLVFWPRTTSPVVVLTNHHPTEAALFGQIRLEAYKQGLPHNPLLARNKRQRIAMLSRPLLKQMFLAKDGFDERNFSFDDWTTFLQAGQRLVEYLRYAGYDGVSLSVAAEGSSLYPSELLRPTPKYDRGIYANTGQDPVRKDVLEMLFRLFDREGLVLMPAIEFSAPLPELERQLAQGASAARGIELMNDRGNRGALADGRPLPFYNPLDQRVQAAVLSVVDELMARYGHHQSFSGLHLHVARDSYLHLPDLKWAADARTVADFATQTTRKRPDSAEVAQLRSAIATEPPTSSTMERWATWRARRLTSLFESLTKRVSPNGRRRVYMSTQDLSTTAPGVGPAAPSETLFAMGIDADALARIDSLTLLRGHRVAPLLNLEEMTQLEPTDGGPVGLSRGGGSLFRYRPQRIELKGFDAKEIGLTSQGTSDAEAVVKEACFDIAGGLARHHFARSLALHDDLVVFSGGPTVAIGQEASTRAFFDVFRQLPNRPFDTLELDAQPIVIRTASTEQETFAYFVNDSPWQATVLVKWKAPSGCQVARIGSAESSDFEQRAKPQEYVVVEPYGLFALRFTTPNVQITECQIELPPNIKRRLLNQYDDVAIRAGELKKRSNDPANTNERWSLSDSQRIELGKVLTVAINRQNQNDLAGWYRILSGYWPRYLLRHVRAPEPRVAANPTPPPKTETAPTKRSKRILDGLRRFVPSFR